VSLSEFIEELGRLGLSKNQLEAVTRSVPIDRRDTFLENLGGLLNVPLGFDTAVRAALLVGAARRQSGIGSPSFVEFQKFLGNGPQRWRVVRSSGSTWTKTLGSDFARAELWNIWKFLFRRRIAPAKCLHAPARLLANCLLRSLDAECAAQALDLLLEEYAHARMLGRIRPGDQPRQPMPALGIDRTLRGVEGGAVFKSPHAAALHEVGAADRVRPLALLHSPTAPSIPTFRILVGANAILDLMADSGAGLREFPRPQQAFPFLLRHRNAIIS